jgi:glycosyltransferase involved in cell wall biosynthesis
LSDPTASDRPAHRLRLSLCITTHARADALAAVLACVVAQTSAPDEILVVEDGEDHATAASLAADEASRLPLRHLRQPHLGFRVARLRNLALAAARGDYLVFVDGDMLLHRGFIADHRRGARRGHYTQGVRINLDERTSRRLLTDPASAPQRFPSVTARGRFGIRRLALWHAPALQPLLRRVGTGLLAVKSCNQGFWREDLIAVNGWDERFEGWGPEDKELCARLEHHGVHRQALLAGGIACHLHHPPASRGRRAFNESLLAETLAARSVRCAQGVADHLPVIGPVISPVISPGGTPREGAASMDTPHARI